MKIDRLTGAEAISKKAVVFSTKSGVLITDCTWDIGDDLEHEHAHRLDLFTKTKTVRLYFRDVELTTSGNDARKKRIEDRLHNAIAQLWTTAPAATYTYE